MLLKCSSLGEANEQYSAFKIAIHEGIAQKQQPSAQVTESRDSKVKQTPAAKKTVTRTVKTEGALPDNQVNEQTSIAESQTVNESSASTPNVTHSILRRLGHQAAVKAA